MMDEGGRMNIGYLIFHPSSLILHPFKRGESEGI
jgi:hypothetical protein